MMNKKLASIFSSIGVLAVACLFYAFTSNASAVTSSDTDFLQIGKTYTFKGSYIYEVKILEKNSGNWIKAEVYKKGGSRDVKYINLNQYTWIKE